MRGRKPHPPLLNTSLRDHPSTPLAIVVIVIGGGGYKLYMESISKALVDEYESIPSRRKGGGDFKKIFMSSPYSVHPPHPNTPIECTRTYPSKCPPTYLSHSTPFLEAKIWNIFSDRRNRRYPTNRSGPSIYTVITREDCLPLTGSFRGILVMGVD